MHAGCRIVAVEEVDGFWRIRVLAKMEEHKSMNYASDFVVRKDGQGEEEIVIVSTSFYDRLVCLWQVPEVEVDETYGKKEEM
jgi:diphthamide biosynthesis protein 7